MGRLMHDLTGYQSGKLTVVKMHDQRCNKSGGILWECKCECGGSKIVLGGSIKNGFVSSCGCIKRGQVPNPNSKERKRIYNVWKKIKSRCYDCRDKYYLSYGGSGIAMCEEWMVFENFYQWCISNGCKKGLYIDRKDNSIGYNPSNCHFVTPKDSTINRRGYGKSKYRWIESCDGKFRVRIGKQSFGRFKDEREAFDCVQSNFLKVYPEKHYLSQEWSGYTE